jgi:hypothetical protein
MTLSTKAQLKREIDTAIASGVAYIRLLDNDYNQIFARNQPHKQKEKATTIINYLTNGSDNLAPNYIIEGYMSMGTKTPALVINYKTRETPAIPIESEKQKSNTELSNNNIQELATLRVENRHLHAQIVALESKLEELMDELDEMHELDAVNKPDPVATFMDHVTKHTPTIMEVVKMFRATSIQAPAPAAVLADPAPAAVKAMTRYTPDYYKWLDHCYSSNPQTFQEEFIRTQNMYPNEIANFNKIIEHYEIES